MEGSVRFADNRVRITTQLVRPEDGSNLWSETYELEFDDIFAIQSDVAQQVAVAMQASLLPEELARIEQPPTQNSEAYSLYLQHWYRYENRNANFTYESIREDGCPRSNQLSWI